MNLKAEAFHEPTFNCPNCNHEIRLTESLAAPLIAASRKRFQEQLASKDAEIVKKSEILRKEQEELAAAKGHLEDEINARLQTELGRITATEAKKARDAAADELRVKVEEAEVLRASLAANDIKLAEAQQAQAEVLRKDRALEEQKRELELTIEQRVNASIDGIRSKARQEADEATRLRVVEKDQTIDSMTRTIEELKRKAEQASQQAQGEALEVNLEEILRARFPVDAIEPVAKGALGADIVQRVNAAFGPSAGIILWELKRTKAWSDTWLSKLREDQRRCGADIALIITQALPKHIEHFDLFDNVWVAHPRYALPVAVALRQSLLELSNSRLAQQGQETKMEHVYQYLTGKRFRQRVEAVIEKFSDMREDLDRERKFMGKQWSKREAQILAAVESTVGVVGDLQGIAGKGMPEISGLDTPLLNGPEAT